jgi:hypothetical protein
MGERGAAADHFHHSRHFTIDIWSWYEVAADGCHQHLEGIPNLWIIDAENGCQLIKLQVLAGGWHEAVRASVPFRHACSGWDHLIVAEAALHGAILFEGRTNFLMRATGTDTDLSDYGKRHLAPEQLANGPQDFINQLEWMIHCVDIAMIDIPREAKPMYRALLTSSMFATYMALRGQNLHVVPGAMGQFNQIQQVQQMFSACAHIDSELRGLLGRV